MGSVPSVPDFRPLPAHGLAGQLALHSDTAYAPYGEDYSSTGSPDVMFTGQNENTVSGTPRLYDFEFRRYSAVAGRWISPDPAGMAAVDITNPQTWNRYAYVMNSPLNFTDPLGLSCANSDDGIPCNQETVNVPACPGQIWTPAGCASSCPGSGLLYVGSFTACGPATFLTLARIQIEDGMQAAQANSGGTSGPANNGSTNHGPKSPARQQCENNANQKYQATKSSLDSQFFNNIRWTNRGQTELTPILSSGNHLSGFAQP